MLVFSRCDGMVAVTLCVCSFRMCDDAFADEMHVYVKNGRQEHK